MKGANAVIATTPGESAGLVASGTAWTDVRPVPSVPVSGKLRALRQARAFQSDWQGFLSKCREETGSAAFRLQLGGPVVVLTCGLSIRAIRDPAHFSRPYGFGVRRPSPSVIGRTVPTIFTDGDLHERRKRLHLQLYREAWPGLGPALQGVLDESLPRWERGDVRFLGVEVERMIGHILFRWLLDIDPPMADLRTVGTGVIPFRPTDRVMLPRDHAVKAAFSRLVARVLASPRSKRMVAAADALGIGPEEFARDFTFALAMNAWAALSGALVSSLAELTRHPEHVARVRDEEGHAKNVLREVLRLHPPAPAVFAVARGDGLLKTSTGSVLLREGDSIMGMLGMAHRDSAVFSDPNAFIPDRFAEPGLADEILWTGGPEGLEPTTADRVCPGKAAAQDILQRILVAICQGRWALQRRPEWGLGITPRSVPPTPLMLVAYKRGPEGVAWSLPARVPSLGDRLRMGLVSVVRSVQRRSVEVWSERTYRTSPRPSQALEAGPAAEILGAPDVPPFLMVPRALPKHGTMGTKYVIPYYYAAGVLFGVLERAGLDPRSSFRPDHESLRAFPGDPEGWGNTQEDDTFGALRLQGPNPYLLTADQGSFIADYRPAFAGITPPVRCRFERDGAALRPVLIEIDGRKHTPGMPSWRRAKLLANALDARLTVFGEHLGRTHLVIAQAFALARFEMPPAHPLRPLLDLHAFGTLQVNDFAYKLLISPSSYFVRSGFISRDQVFRIFHNQWPRTDAIRLLPERDIASRGLDKIPGHPYVEEAMPAWRVLLAYTRRVVDAYYDDDGAVCTDTDLSAWDRKLRSLLPAPAAALLPSPRSRASLAELLAAWVYNNVSHELCGDFSPYASGCDDEQARLIDFDRLRMGMENGPVSLPGVFLMKQGAYAGLFDTRGNSMLGVNPASVTTCPTHAAALRDLQRDLRALSREVKARNAVRRTPMLRMDPAKWELSIGF